MKKKYIFLFFLIGLISILSCEEPECNRQTLFFLQIDFYAFNEESTGNSSKITVNELTVFGMGKQDNLLYNSTNNVRSIILPLNNNTEQSTFVIENELGTDTLTIGYIPRPEYISKECGVSMTYSINDTTSTRNGIQDLRIINPLVNANSNENIRLFY
ncbi:DUF6452 family protein [Membranihabitans maritimus]|uniref:DUF6452 family protein n=1 Tax=Membranihabitans maritimus TaxID=2904244 RepID=UPI001F1AFB35|nr:DUF6452 family protein [Membranihabitans maritimus]